MKPHALLALSGLLVLPSLFAQDQPQTVADMKKLVEGLGHTTKMLNEKPGLEKFEFMVKRGQYEVPITCELTPDKAFVRFQALLGPAPTESAKYVAILKANDRILPALFYMDQSNALKVGVALHNGGITPAEARRATDGIAEAIVQTEGIW